MHYYCRVVTNIPNNLDKNISKQYLQQTLKRLIGVPFKWNDDEAKNSSGDRRIELTSAALPYKFLLLKDPTLVDFSKAYFRHQNDYKLSYVLFIYDLKYDGNTDHLPSTIKREIDSYLTEFSWLNRTNLVACSVLLTDSRPTPSKDLSRLADTIDAEINRRARTTNNNSDENPHLIRVTVDPGLEKASHSSINRIHETSFTDSPLTTSLEQFFIEEADKAVPHSQRSTPTQTAVISKSHTRKQPHAAPPKQDKRNPAHIDCLIINNVSDNKDTEENIQTMLRQLVGNTFKWDEDPAPNASGIRFVELTSNEQPTKTLRVTDPSIDRQAALNQRFSYGKQGLVLFMYDMQHAQHPDIFIKETANNISLYIKELNTYGFMTPSHRTVLITGTHQNLAKIAEDIQTELRKKEGCSNISVASHQPPSSTAPTISAAPLQPYFNTQVQKAMTACSINQPSKTEKARFFWGGKQNETTRDHENDNEDKCCIM